MRYVIAAVGVVFSLGVVFMTPTHTVDLRSDWLTVKGVTGGADLAEPMATYSGDYGVGIPNDRYHPRTPGAVLLLMPLALLGLDSVVTVGRLLLVAEAAAAAVLAARFFRRPMWTVGLMPVYFLWIAGAALMVTGGRSILVLVCILASLLFGRRGDSMWAGVPLGVAVCLKLWPWAIPAVLFLTGRRRMALGALGTFTALNFGGLLLPGVSVASSVAMLTGGAEWISYHDNGSLASLLAMVLPSTVAMVVGQLLLVVAVVWCRCFRWDDAVPAVIPFAVFLAPLAWPHYLTAVLLTVGWVIHRDTRLVWLVVPAGFVWLAGIAPGLTGSVILLVAIASVFVDGWTHLSPVPVEAASAPDGRKLESAS